MSRLLGFIHDRVERDGHHVEYFCAEQVPARFKGRLGRHAFSWLVWRHAVAAARAGRPFDVVNVHEPSAAVLALGKRAAGNPFIAVTTHGVEDRSWGVTLEDTRLGRSAVALRTRIWHPLAVLTQARVGFRRADHVFCLNEEDRTFLRKKYRLPDDRITRVFPAADTAYLTAYEYRTYAAADRVAYFGTWLVRKGTPDLVAAFVALAARHPALKLVIMGAGFPEEAVRGSFPESLRHRVEIVPPGPAEEYARRLLGAAAYVIPSVFEGTPLTLVEAMATGLPPVATATCGMRDVVRDQVNGLLVPVRDPPALITAIDRLLANPGLRERLGRRAAADVAENYTWDRTAAPVRDVYNRLAERSRKQA